MNPLFNLMVEAQRLGQTFNSAHPTEHQRATQEELDEVFREVPPVRLTPEEIDQLATRFDRLSTDDIQEGRIKRPFRTNPHD